MWSSSSTAPPCVSSRKTMGCIIWLKRFVSHNKTTDAAVNRWSRQSDPLINTPRYVYMAGGGRGVDSGS